VDVLLRLVDTSLVLVGDTDPVRYRLLQPIAQYARTRLEKLEDAAAVHRAHAGYFLRLAEEGASGMLGHDQLVWLKRLDAERYNLIAALGWMHEIGDATGVVRMAAALRMRWMIRREVAEGTRWLGTALADRGDASPETVVSALNGAALLAIRRLDVTHAAEWLREAHELATEIADPRIEAAQVAGLSVLAWFRNDDDSEADALASKALSMEPDRWTRAWMYAHRGTLARVRGDYEEAAGNLAAAHEILLERGGGFDLAWSFLRLGALAKDLGQYALATRHFQEGRILLDEAGDTIGLAHADAGLGALAWLRGDHEQALTRYESVLTGFGRAEEIGDNLFELRTMLQGRVSSAQLKQIAAWNQERARLGLAGIRAALAEHIFHLGKTAFRRGELDRARNALLASLELCKDAEDHRGACIALIALGRVCAAAGDAERSIILLACARWTASADGLAPWPPVDEPDFDRHVAEARRHLPPGIYERAWDRGARMTLNDALLFVAANGG
jgi:tetratricopeptide (TPR) repeat protein